MIDSKKALARYSTGHLVHYTSSSLFASYVTVAQRPTASAGLVYVLRHGFQFSKVDLVHARWLYMLSEIQRHRKRPKQSLEPLMHSG